MKFFSLPTILIAALFSFGAVTPFLPTAHRKPDLFSLEIRLSSSLPGSMQVYYDDGRGFRETASTRIPLAKSEAQVSYLLTIPVGTYKQFRFDPTDNAGTIIIESAQLVDKQGHVIRKIPLGDIKSLAQIQSRTEINGHLEITPEKNASDSQMLIEFNPTLRLRIPWIKPFSEHVIGALIVFGISCTVLLSLDRTRRVWVFIPQAISWIKLRPQRAVIIMAAVAVIASSYPVVFLGKSFVSPNLGTALLYDAFPTLPGYNSSQSCDVKGSDIGAIMWAFVPYGSTQNHALIHDGQLPLWNRYNSCGTPLLGQGQSMFGDPLHLLVVAANSAAWAWDLKYLLAKWLFAACLGLCAFAITKHLPAALIVGGVTPFIGFFLYRLNHPALFSMCYAPLPLYCWIRLSLAFNRRDVTGWIAALVIANLTLMSSGTIKEAYMLLLSMNFSGFCALLVAEIPWRERLGRLAGASIAGMFFVMITAPVWLTFLDSLKTSYTQYDSASAFQIQPSLILGAFDEAFYRPLSKQRQVFNPSANFIILGGMLYWLVTLRQHFSKRTIMALAISAILPLSIAFGLIPPAWMMSIPFLANVAHTDNTFSCALIIIWSILAGVGFASAAKRLGTSEGRDDLIVAGVLLFTLVFAWIGFGQAVHRQVYGADQTMTVFQLGESLRVKPFVWVYLTTLLSALTAIGILARRALVQHRLTPVLGLGLAVSVALLLWRHGLHAEAFGFEDYVARPTVRVNLQAPSEATSFVYSAQLNSPARSIGLYGNFFPGWTGVYNLEGVNGPDALMNPWYQELLNLSPLERLWGWRIFVTQNNIAVSQAFLDFLNVRYFLSPESYRKELSEKLTFVTRADLDVFESPTAWPRAFFTDRLMIYDRPEKLIEAIKQGNRQPFASVQASDLASAPELEGLPRDLAGRSVTPATLYKLTGNKTSFQIHSNGPGVVVLNEAWLPKDFKATLDGKPAKIIRMNHAFKGIVVNTSGDHLAEFRYWPHHFTLSLSLCVAGLALGACSAFWGLRRMEQT